MVYGFITSCCFLLVFSLVCTVQWLSVSTERKLTMNVVALHGRATQQAPTSTAPAKGSYVQWPHHLSTCYVFLCSEPSLFVLAAVDAGRGGARRRGGVRRSKLQGAGGALLKIIRQMGSGARDEP